MYSMCTHSYIVYSFFDFFFFAGGKKFRFIKEAVMDLSPEEVTITFDDVKGVSRFNLQTIKKYRHQSINANTLPIDQVTLHHTV